MSKHFVVMVAGICQAGMEDYVAQHLKSIMQHSRNHPGCFIYNIHQSAKNPKEFMMYSEWENQEAFEAHNETPVVDELKHKLAKVLFTQESSKTYWHVLD